MADTFLGIPIPRTAYRLAMLLRGIGDAEVAIQRVADAGLGSALATTPVQVGTAATALPATALAGRAVLNVENHGSVTVFVGASNVQPTDGGGMKIAPGASRSFGFSDGNTLYGIVASGQAWVNVTEAA